MALTVVRTKQPLVAARRSGRLVVGACVCDALRTALSATGETVLMVPSFSQSLDVQRALAQETGLALSVTVTTPTAWVKERWEVWGDGRTIADATVLSVLAARTIRTCPAELMRPLELSRGLVQVLAQLVGRALPWLPLDGDGRIDEARCAEAGLTEAETRLMALAGELGSGLAEHGYLCGSEAFVAVPQALAHAGARIAPVVLAGFSALSCDERALVRALAELTEVTLVLTTVEGPAGAQGERLVAQLIEDMMGVRQIDDVLASVENTRDPQLAALLDELFADEHTTDVGGDAVELLLAAGPQAEAELIAQRVVELAKPYQTGEVMPVGSRAPIVVCVPDMSRARRELVGKLASRGVPTRLQHARALLDCPAAWAFFGYAQTVAHLAELAASWPLPRPGEDGLMLQLGDMDWWPPHELTDFLLNEISHMDAGRAWRLDAQMRGNRLLTPTKVLDLLRREGTTSAAVAQATAELLAGRIGRAARRLLEPYRVRESVVEDRQSGLRSDEAQAVLEGIARIADALHELGMTADPKVSGALSLSDLVELCTWAAEGVSVVTRVEVACAQDASLEGRTPSSAKPLVELMESFEAATLAPGSVASLVLCGQTAEEQPLGSGESLLQALLELLRIEDAPDELADARASFHALVAAPREKLLVERALHDVDAKEAYPSVMLSELLAACGDAAKGLACHHLAETALACNLSQTGVQPLQRKVAGPAPAGRLTGAARELVFVPQDGTPELPGGKPVLSASQIETYLDCPYKWFSLRRLRLGTVDAGHSPMELGTFAHRVMEKTHGILLARSLGAGELADDEKALRVLGEEHLTEHLPGSRVDEDNLDEARVVLAHEFDLHQQHMYMVKNANARAQLLVAHNAAERASERQLRDDLLSALAYEAQLLQGFEPRLFEWSFGRHGDLVEYAGAYVTGTIDRVDVSPHGTAVIIDYKHKNPAGFTTEYDALRPGVLEGEVLPNRIQSLMYAQVARRAFGEQLRLVGTVYLSTRSPHALAGAADENVADLVFGGVSSKRAERVVVPRTADGSSGMEELLDRTEALIAEQVAQMLAGNVEARPRDARSCDFCPVMQCEKRMA